MRQRLVTRKNRKLRQLRALHPEIRVEILYRRDYEALMGGRAVPLLDCAVHGPGRADRLTGGNPEVPLKPVYTAATPRIANTRRAWSRRRSANRSTSGETVPEPRVAIQYETDSGVSGRSSIVIRPAAASSRATLR